MKQRVWLIALYIAGRLPCYPQFLPDLQAKTPPEYDAYLDALDRPLPQNGPAFERNFPDSALRLPVCEILAREWRSRGQREEAIAAAERGLALAPDYTPLLIEFADLLANGSSRLDLADRSARRGLELLDRTKAPMQVEPAEWTSAVARLRARAWSAIGLVRFKRNDDAGAIRAFESALAAGAADDPALHYRLGRLYAVKGRLAEARHELEKAAASPDKLLSEPAKKALAELR